MTIIKPSVHQTNLRFLILIFILVLVGGLLYIFEYNALVEKRAKLKILKKSIIELQAINADLKNDFYRAVDTAKLEKIAQENGLKFEKQPEYLNINQWLSDSSH
jgi:cell division protein FtsL